MDVPVEITGRLQERQNSLSGGVHGGFMRAGRLAGKGVGARRSDETIEVLSWSRKETCQQPSMREVQSTTLYTGG